MITRPISVPCMFLKASSVSRCFSLDFPPPLNFITLSVPLSCACEGQGGVLALLFCLGFLGFLSHRRNKLRVKLQQIVHISGRKGHAHRASGASSLDVEVSARVAGFSSGEETGTPNPLTHGACIPVLVCSRRLLSLFSWCRKTFYSDPLSWRWDRARDFR